MSFRSDSITGSLFGTSSWAVTASNTLYAPTFPYSGSARVSGSLYVNSRRIFTSEVLYASLSNTGIQTGSDIPFSAYRSTPRRTIGISTPGGSGTTFTLRSGSIYTLEYTITSLWGPATPNTMLDFQFVNAATNSPIGRINTQGRILENSSGSLTNKGNTAFCLIAPTSSVGLKVRVVSGSGWGNIGNGNSLLVIRRIQ